MNITITSPTLADIDILWKWGEENWELWSDKKYKWFSKESLKLWIENPEDDVLLVAKDGNKLIGMCFMSTMRDWAFCFGLFVEKAYRGKSVGKKLLDESSKQLKKKGVRSFGLLVDTKNKSALKFYKREGLYQGYSFYLMIKKLKEEL